MQSFADQNPSLVEHVKRLSILVPNQCGLREYFSKIPVMPPIADEEYAEEPIVTPMRYWYSARKVYAALCHYGTLSSISTFAKSPHSASNDIVDDNIHTLCGRRLPQLRHLQLFEAACRIDGEIIVSLQGLGDGTCEYEWHYGNVVQPETMLVGKYDVDKPVGSSDGEDEDHDDIFIDGEDEDNDDVATNGEDEDRSDMSIYEGEEDHADVSIDGVDEEQDDILREQEADGTA